MGAARSGAPLVMTDEQIDAIHAFLRARGDVVALLAIDAVISESAQTDDAALHRINEILTKAMPHE